MYFNRKNAEQKNWRMIKKGKHFLFGCSLVFAIGAALVAPSVKADTVEANPEAGSTTEEIKPVVAGDNVTYAAPAVEVAPSTPVAPATVVAEEKAEKPATTTENSKEEAVVATDKVEKAKEADSIQAPEVTVVYNPSALTDEEKAKVVAAVKAANPTATDVQVQADGSVVVTFADGSTASLSAAQTIKDGSQVAKPRRARAAVAAPVITSNLDGKGSSATDVTVQAPAGSTVKLYNSDGTVIGQAVANAQGVATVTPTNSLPVGEITATATPAGESESPKSAPVTATRPTLTTVEGGVSRGNDSDNTQLLVTKSHITVYPGESVKIGVVAVSKEMENFSVPKNPEGVKGLLPTGVYLKTAGTETYKRRDNGYGGTVAWDQPAGDTVVTFAVRSKNNVVVTRDLKVTVLELTKKLDAVPGEKVEVADLNNVSEDEKNKIIAATKKANASFPPGTLYNVDQRGNLVITYPDKSTDKIDASYLVTPSNKPADTNKPAGQAPEITSDLSGKASTPADVTVKATAGSTVKLYNNDGVVIGEAVANDQGVATITPTNSLPEGEITATSTPAGGSESAKSAPITVTKTPILIENAKKTEGPYQLQMITNTIKVTLHRGDKLTLTGDAAGTALRFFGITKDTAFNVSGVEPTGGLRDNKNSRVTNWHAEAKGTVSWKQPLGDTMVVFRAEGSPDPISRQRQAIERKITVTVLETTKKYDPVAGTKVDVADSNNLSGDDKNKIIDSVKTANPSLPAGSQYSVDEKGNLTITYPDGSTDKIAAAYLVTPVAKEADKYTPTAKAQTVDPGSTPDAKNSIGNTGELPSGTSFAYKTPVDTATKGEKDTIVVVTYPDKSTDEVPVKVTVKDPRSDADKNDPKAKAQDIYKGSTPDAKGSIDNAGELPYGTSFAYKTPVDTETPGEKDATVVVTYPDGSKDEVPVKVTVEDPDKTSAENNTPTAKDQTVKVGEKPSAKDSIGNFDKLPKGTTFEFKTPVDTATPGEKDAIVVVTYPDSLTYEVPVKVTVKDPRTDADKNTPVAKDQSVKPGDKPNAKDSIGNVGDLPSGTKFEYKTPVDTTTEGDKDAIVVVTYPDGSKDEVPVKVTVKDPRTDADKNTPVAKDQSVKPSDKPNAKDSIDNVGDLPSGTKFEYKTPVDTTTEGDKDAIVVVTYPDGSKDEVPVKVTVKDPRTDADKNTPVAKDQSIKPGSTPNAKDSIGNVGDLPSGTKFEYKTPVDTTTEGDKDAIVVVTYPDGSKDEVPVKVTVKDPRTDADKNTPVAKDQSVKPGDKPNAKDSIDNVGDLPSGTKFEYKTPVDTTTEGDKDAIVVVTYPDGSKDEVPVKVTVKDPRTDADKNTPVAKDQSVKPGDKPNAKDSIGNVGDLPSGTKFEYKTPVDTTTEGDKDAIVVVTYPDGSKDEVPVKVTVKDPRTDADKNTPVAKDQSVKPGSTPNAKDSIGNVGDLPSGTKFEYKTPVDTTTEGDKDAIVVVTYPDGSKDEVPVKVTVKDPRTDADKNTPVAKDQSVKPGSTPNAKDSIGNVGDLPSGTKFEYKTPVDTTTEGDKDAIVVVTYPDGSKDEVPVKVTVKDPRTDADKNTPVAKDQSVKPGSTPNAKDSIGNVGDLPSGTKFEYKTPVDTTTEGDKDAIVVVTYPDGSKDEVPVKVTVKDPRTDADKNTPVAKDQSVKPGDKPNAKDSIGNVGDLPSGTKFEYKTPVDTTTEGDKDAIVVVTYPDGSKDEVPVKVTVKDPRTDADKNTPVAKDQSVKPGDKPNAKDSIGNVGDLPSGTKFEYKTPVDTTTEGDKDAIVVVTYPDGSKDEVPVKVTVKDPRTDADKNTPVAKDQSVKPGDKPNAKDSIGNVGDLPSGTKFEYKTPVDTTTEGDKDAIVVVTYPDGSKDEVPVKVTVKDPRTDADKNTPVAKDQSVKPGSTPNAKDSIGNVGDLPSGTKFEYKTPVDTATDGEKDATVVVTYPDGSKDEVPVKVTVKDPRTDADKNTPVAKDQSVKPGDKPNAKDSIGNVGDLPSGTKFEYKTPVDTTTEGDKDAIVVVTYPDGSKDEVPVKVTVKDPRTDADKNTPVAKDQSVKPGDKPNAKDSIGNVGDLPSGTKFEYKTPVDTTTEGDKDAIVVVTYPDGSKDEVPVKVTVKDPRTDADKNTPVAKDQSVKPGDKPNAKDSIGNVGDLPSGTKFEYKTPVDTTTEGDKDAIVVVTYPDGSKDEVPVKVTVKDPRTDADKNTPVAKDQSVKPGSTPNAKDSIGNVGDLPSGTKFEYKTPVDTATDGEKDATVVVTYPDGSKDEVPVKVTVKDSSALTQPEITTDLTGKAGTKTPVEVTADPGSKVELYDKDGNKIGEATAGEDGKATITPTVDIPEGNVTVVSSKDGQTPEASDPVQATAATPETSAKPSKPVVTTDLTGKAGTKTPVEVTADPGTKVELFDKDGNKIGEGVTGEDGKASITPTVEIPAGPVTAKASKDGKTSDESTPKVATKDPAITPVVNPSALTDAEKAKVAEEVKKANPTASKVEVGNDGTATVTFPDGSVAVLTPEKTVKEADSNGVKTPAITPVVNPSALTDAEKAKVAEEVKKANPTASKVEVSNDGTATVTFPDGSVAVLTPEKTVKEADSNGVKTPAITPVVNPSALTDAEKAKVAEEVKKANPTASKVEVGNDGTATVTFPDGSVAVLTPEKTVKEADSNGVKTPAVTPVVNPSSLTDAEKAKVADEVKKANPTASKVEVGNDGTATVTFPDGSVAVLTPEKTVKEADSNGVKTPAVTPVVNPSALTDAEKAKVADEVKKANPTAKDIKVNKDGSVVVTFEDGSTAIIPADKTVKKSSDKAKESDGVKNPSVTPVTDPSNLTDAEKAKVADEVKKANPTAKDIKVNKDGSVVVTFADGSVAVLASENVVKEATKESPAQEPAKKAGAKELPNTGTKQSSASLALALLAAATGGLLIAKKREEEE